MHVHKNDAKRKIILKHCFFVSRERNKLKATVDSLKDSVQKGSRFNVRPESIADFENREFYVKLLELEILIEKRISEGELFSKTRKRRQCTFVIYKRKFTKEILIEISFIRLYNNEKIKNFFLMTQGLPTHSTKSFKKQVFPKKIFTISMYSHADLSRH